ncbi:hypothetical protein BOTBODRAFT_36940 [Botryobasidium botryosum FD-172 SS1]|uniref:Myb-like domain-containing protein n=1 Tax=Botryobasidium botryosum (strain FD-172 SS1) TaxID=930990 RepID=A0A067M1U2_BOTB1|nr:hypothetical protein BOTBODRAFT_36940 [Botryobasidium botryosum FD-172 SS1]
MESLEKFLEDQRILLENTLEDIRKLQALKEKALSNPEHFIDNLQSELNDPVYRLSDHPEKIELPTIEWGLLAGQDPSGFSKITIPSSGRTRTRLTPSAYETHIKTIIAKTGPIDMESFPAEGMEQNSSEDVPMHDTPKEKETDRAHIVEPYSKHSKHRKPVCSLRLRSQRRLHSPKVEPEVTVDIPPVVPTPIVKEQPPVGDPPPARSATFNLPWTPQEQRLLERYLLEIPSTERHRWVKISKAMGGTRTARQVASRVQKYNEKMKKFGLEVVGV